MCLRTLHDWVIKVLNAESRDFNLSCSPVPIEFCNYRQIIHLIVLPVRECSWRCFTTVRGKWLSYWLYYLYDSMRRYLLNFFVCFCLASYLVKGYLQRRFSQVSNHHYLSSVWNLLSLSGRRAILNSVCELCLLSKALPFFPPGCFPHVSLWCTQGSCIKLMMPGMIDCVSSGWTLCWEPWLCLGKSH